MATAVWNANLAPYGFIDTHFPSETPSLDRSTDAADHAKYTFSNGTAVELTGDGLKFNLDGSPSEGSFTSAVITDESGKTLLTLKNFSLSASELWSDTIAHGWSWDVNGNNGFLGSILKGGDTLKGSNAEDQLLGWTGNDNIGGGDGNDHIFAWFGNDKVHGDAGNDFIDTGDDEDKAFGDSGNDEIHGHGGKDALSGGGGNDSIYGGSGNDKLNGGGGDDFLYGEEGTNNLGGKDLMIGGKGADTFAFAAATDSPSMADRDLIKDFNHRQHDHISFADAYDGELQFMTNGHFKGHHVGSVYAEIISKHHDTLVYVDLDGDRKADMVVESVHAVVFKAADFDL